MGGGKARSAAERTTGAVHDKTIINQIMLRFRPIAPKPIGEGDSAGSGDTKAANSLGKKRSKRKYVRLNKSKVSVNDKADKSVVTLQLLPVSGERSPSAEFGSDLMVGDAEKVERGLKSSDRTVVMVPRRVVESWLTMECVTDGYENIGWLGSSDVEKVKNMEVDRCPGFIFDGIDVVQWVNSSYKRMIIEEDEDAQVVVWAAVKGRFPVEKEAFTCRVRVAYSKNTNTNTNAGGGSSDRYTLTIPCDVWKMDYGGFACRLDVEAALSLGR